MTVEKVKKVENWFSDNKLSYELIKHKPVHRVGDEGPEHDGFVLTKCLLLIDSKSDRIMMVAMRGENRLDLKKLAEIMHSGRLSFVKPDDVERLAGVTPGTVSVFNALLKKFNPKIELIFDASLLKTNSLGFHPNVNTATIQTDPKNIIKFCEQHFSKMQVARL